MKGRNTLNRQRNIIQATLLVIHQKAGNVLMMTSKQVLKMQYQVCMQTINTPSHELM